MPDPIQVPDCTYYCKYCTDCTDHCTALAVPTSLQDNSGHDHRVFYPTPRSLQERLQFLEKQGAGLSIWELGQGVERFFDLL